MPRFDRRFDVFVLLLLFAGVSSVKCQTSRVSAVSGFVRDGQGAALVGTAVRVSAANRAVIASAVTDSAGHYAIARLAPGRYSILARGPMSGSSAQRVIWLRSGVRSVANLVLIDSVDRATWLPAHAPPADEADDEWQWALRSGSNRAILRVLETSDDEAPLTGGDQRRSALQHTVSLKQHSGGFGDSGASFDVSEVLSRRDERLRWDFGLRTPHRSGSDAVATRVSAQGERPLGPAGQQRLLLSFQSEPQIVTNAGRRGISAFRAANAERLILGEKMTLEVGSVLDVVRLEDLAVSLHPFLRLRIDPKSGWAVGYQMATVPEAQGYDGLDELRGRLPDSIEEPTGPTSAGVQHQEIFVEKRGSKSNIRVRYFRDSAGFVAVRGLLPANAEVTLTQSRRSSTETLDGLQVDPSSFNLRTLVSAAHAQGWSVGVTGEMSSLVHLGLTYSRGAALSSPSPDRAFSRLRQREAEALALEVAWEVPPTRTKLAVSYRMQTPHTVTSVDPFGTPLDNAYLGFHLRQPLGEHGTNPSRVTLTADGTNLLQEGMVPVTAGGETLLLAQAPRGIVAGLALTF